MANNSNGSLSIPVWMIVLAWFLYAPAGLILTIIKYYPKIKNFFKELTSSSSQGSTSGTGTTVHYSSSSSGGTTTYYASMSSSPGTATHYASSYRKDKNEEKGTQVQNTSKPSEAKPASQSADPAKKDKQSVGSVMRVFGYVALGFAAVALIMGIPDVMTQAWLTDTLPMALLFAATGFGLVWGGMHKKNKATRLSTIKLLIGKRDSIHLSKLAAATGSTIKQAAKDVQSLIDKGELGPEAYVDLANENFMRNPDVSPDSPTQFDYMSLYGKKNKKGQKEDVTAGEEPVKDDFELASDNENYREIIREIRRLNVEIKDEAISEKIYEIEAYTKTIFEFVSSHPGEESKIHTFLNYYLPTTLKLLESYSEIEKVGVAGENMKKSKENIEATMNMMATAFKLQIDDLFRSESIDISSDISVLETMVNKDGLTGKSDFDIEAFTEAVKDEVSSGGAAALDAPKPEIK